MGVIFNPALPVYRLDGSRAQTAPGWIAVCDSENCFARQSSYIKKSRRDLFVDCLIELGWAFVDDRCYCSGHRPTTSQISNLE